MKTNNTKYLDEKKNREYYSKSDGEFLDDQSSLVAHKILDRVYWVREWVHTLGSMKHLDVGCKDGYTALTLTAEGVECVAIDPSVDAIEIAKKKAEATGYDVKYQVGFLEDIDPENTPQFETVSCMEVIEHVVNVDKFMTILSQLGLYVMITTPDAEGQFGILDSKSNEEHVRLYTKSEFEEMINQYGVIEEIVQRDNQLYCIYKPHVLWQTKPSKK